MSCCPTCFGREEQRRHSFDFFCQWFMFWCCSVFVVGELSVRSGDLSYPLVCVCVTSIFFSIIQSTSNLILHSFCFLWVGDEPVVVCVWALMGGSRRLHRFTPSRLCIFLFSEVIVVGEQTERPPPRILRGIRFQSEDDSALWRIVS